MRDMFGDGRWQYLRLKQKRRSEDHARLYTYAIIPYTPRQGITKRYVFGKMGFGKADDVQPD